MSTTTIPSPTFGFLYPSTSLPGITCTSSRWEVLKAFLASSNGALVSRLREVQNGLLFITTIPGEHHSGAIYAYSAVRRAVFMLDLDGRDDDFAVEEFDALIETFALELAFAPGAWLATRRPRRFGHGKQHNFRRTPVAVNATT
jgi:hypothetical protein